MASKISRSGLRAFVFTVIVSASSAYLFAQDDPDPNSPTPVLLSESTTTRALAARTKDVGRVPLSRIETRAFFPNQKAVFFVTNIDLMKGEGATAFRIYAEDSAGHTYRFPVLDLEEVAGNKGVYAVTTLLRDEIGYYEPPKADGDVLIYLTWRGLASNRIKLGLGRVGGDIKDADGAVPTPLGKLPVTVKARPKYSRGESPDYVGYRWSGDRSRWMEQATFGPETNLDNRIRRIGLKAWLAEQFAAPYASLTANCPGYPTVADSLAYPCQPQKPANVGGDPLCDGGADDVPVTCVRDTYSMYPIQTWFLKYAFYGDAQLRHRTAWALSQIWVTSGAGIQQSRHMVEWHKVLSNNAFGSFRKIMGDLTVHGTMGDYLDMNTSTKNSPNENYAREIMQLFTIGLYMLNQDGTLQLDGNNNPIPTYDQTGVNNLTKVLTGWQMCNNGASCPNAVSGGQNYIDPMVLVNNNHDLTAKTLLNYPGAVPADRDIAACTGCTGTAIATYANASMNHALDNLFNHPNVGPFISKNLIQQMVTGDPTPAYVGRVAAVFNNNGFGVRGDLKAVVRAILLDPEARGDVKTDPNYGKLREPVQLMTNLFRELNVTSADGLSQSDGNVNNFLTNMSQNVFTSPTVFNYFPPGYIVPGTTLNGPEFAIMTTGTSVARANFVNSFAFGQVNVALPNSPNGTKLTFTDLQAIAAADPTSSDLLDELNRRMLHGTMTAQNKNTIMTAVNAAALGDGANRAKTAVYLIATSSQYQVQR